jgi:hypothetical protein
MLIWILYPGWRFRILYMRCNLLALDTATILGQDLEEWEIRMFDMRLRFMRGLCGILELENKSITD